MKIAIDSGVAMAVRGVKQKIEQGDNSSANFWNMHAGYWDERSDFKKAAECRAEARAARGLRDDD